MADRILELFADFPPAARTLLIQYMAYWKIYPIEKLLFASYEPSIRTGTYPEVIPRDMLLKIMKYTQDSEPLKNESGDGVKYSVCGYEHRWDGGPTTVLPDLTVYCLYGAAHRGGGHPALVTADQNGVVQSWMEHGILFRPHNFPTTVATTYASGKVKCCRAVWLNSQGLITHMQRATRSKYTKNVGVKSERFYCHNKYCNTTMHVQNFEHLMDHNMSVVFFAKTEQE